jgi:hypothetical protein
LEKLEPRIALAVAPIAAPDAGSVGTVDGFNAPLVVSAASGLLANDSDPDLGDVITFRFQGRINATDADFTAGDVFTGTYSFRASATALDHPDSTLNAQYLNSNVPFEVYFPAKGYRFTGDNLNISVGNNTVFGDRYIATMNNPVSVGAPLPSGRTIAFAQFDVQDHVSGGADMLTNDSIQKRSPDISLATTRGGRFVFTNNNQPNSTLDQLDGPLQVTAVNGNAAAVGQTIILASGAAVTVQSNGAWTYNPGTAFDPLPAGALASDSFTYRVTDVQGLSSTGNVSILVSGDNDAPILTGANNFMGLSDGQASNAGNLVSDLISGRVSDIDQGSVQGIAVTSLTTVGGSWEFSTDAGSTWSPVGAVSPSAALLLRAQDRLRFVPSSPTSASVTFRAWDQTSGTAGSKVSTGTTAFSTSSATSTISVSDDDSSPPVITLGGSLGAETDGQNQIFTWDITDASGIIAYQVTVTRNGSNILTQNFPNSFQNSVTGGVFNFNSYGLGTFVIGVSATDADNDRPGDTLSSTVSRTVIVTDDDTTPPSLTLGGSTGTVTDADSPFFTWTSSDASGVQRSIYFLVKDGVTLHSETFGSPSGTFGGIDSYVGQYGLGTYEFIVTVVDDDNDWDSDRLSTSASRTVTVIDDDTAGPAIKLGGSEGNESDDQNQLFTWNIMDASGIAARQVSITRNGGNIFTQNSSDSGSFDFNNFGTGEYVITVSATDADNDRPGDSLSSAASRTVIVTDDDITPPSITLTGSQGIEIDGQANFMTWTFDDPSGIAASNVTLTRDGQTIFQDIASTPGIGHAVGFNSSGLGTYVLSVSVIDADNDWSLLGSDQLSSSATRTVTVIDDDTVAPTITLGGSVGSETEDQNQVFTWDVIDSSGISARQVSITRNGGNIFAQSSSDSGSFDFNSFGPGEYVITVAATDGDNDWVGDQLSSFATRTVTVTNVPPEIESMVPSSSSIESGLVTLVGAITDPSPASLSQVVSFDELGHAGFGVGPTFNTYASGGFVFRGYSGGLGIGEDAQALASMGSNTPSAYPGSAALLNRFFNGTTQLARQDGRPFDLLSLDLSESNRDAGSANRTITFVGTKADASTVTASVMTDGTFGFQRMQFSNFTGLVSVHWQGLSTHVDNVELQSATTESFSLEINWGDSLSPNNAQTFSLGAAPLSRAVDGIDWDPAARLFAIDHQYLDDNPTGTASDVYTIGVTVTDDYTGQATASTTATVNNVAPALAPLALSSSAIDENGTVTVNGTFTDPGTLDTHEVLIDWGDGSTPTIISLNGGERSFSATYQYLDDGPSATPSHTYTITATITDDDTGVGSASATIQVNNIAPVLHTIVVTPEVDENGVVSLSLSANDVGTLDTHSILIDWGDGSTSTHAINTPGGFSFGTLHTYLDDNPTGTPQDEYTISVTVTDDDGGSAGFTRQATVHNVAPHSVAIDEAVQSYVFALGTPMSFAGSFSDVGTLDNHTAVWTFSHVVGLNTVTETRTGTVNQGSGSGTIANTFVFDNDGSNQDGAGVYTVTLTVTDDDTGAQTSQSRTFVVYDPSAGFVTGGGWINSPAGAYAADPALTGKATFGFVSQYKKGATTPTGQTEFQFKVANLNFHSSNYEWLVVAGARAQYKGTGTINGQGNYGFILTAIDGQINGGGGVDKFRIKIWDRATDNVVYDNQVGAGDDAAPSTALGGGQIVIHKGSNSASATTLGTTSAKASSSSVFAFGNTNPQVIADRPTTVGKNATVSTVHVTATQRPAVKRLDAIDLLFAQDDEALSGRVRRVARGIEALMGR